MFFKELEMDESRNVNGGITGFEEAMLGIFGAIVYASINEYVIQETGQGLAAHTVDAIESAADAWDGYSKSKFLYKLTH